MPRFAILVHDHPFLHWDLLLENGETCRTWRLLIDPDSKIVDITAEEIPDHRRLYLDYEGPIGGDRGSVTQWDSGIFDWQVNQPDRCEVKLEGDRWRGLFRLERINGPDWKAIWSS